MSALDIAPRPPLSTYSNRKSLKKSDRQLPGILSYTRKIGVCVDGVGRSGMRFLREQFEVRFSLSKARSCFTRPFWGALGRHSGPPGPSGPRAGDRRSRRHTALKLKEIGEHCGRMDYAAVSQAHHRMTQQLAEDRRLATILGHITKRLPM